MLLHINQDYTKIFNISCRSVFFKQRTSSTMCQDIQIIPMALQLQGFAMIHECKGQGHKQSWLNGNVTVICVCMNLATEPSLSRQVRHSLQKRSLQVCHEYNKHRSHPEEELKIIWPCASNKIQVWMFNASPFMFVQRSNSSDLLNLCCLSDLNYHSKPPQVVAENT